MRYGHITVDTKIGDVIDHPAFQGKGNLLFPWDDRLRNHPEKTMRYAPRLHLWHSHMDPQQMVDGVNRLIDDVSDGKQVLYDIYDQEEKARDPEKQNTGLFFFRGDPGAPFGIICPGGGYYYVGSLHTGFPVAMELNKHGYNAFVLNYRVGDYILGEYKCNEDLIRAAHFILEHAGELEVCPEDYAIGGESAGARITSNVCYGEAGVKRPEELLHPAAAIIAYVFFEGHPDFQPDDPAAYFIIGGRDHLVRQRDVTDRYEEMKSAGIPAVCRVFPTAPHGFGLGTGTEAEGWIDDAVAFWEQNMKNQAHIQRKAEVPILPRVPGEIVKEGM